MASFSAQPETAKPLTIVVYSDVICPWCYIGKHRLEQGLAASGQQAEVTWLPYELNPDMPEEGVDRTAYLDAKFGPGKRPAIEARLTEAAAEDGLAFNWDKVTRTPNTRKAHILIALATGLGIGNAAKGALMRAFFHDGRDIGNETVLCEIGAALGIETMELKVAFVDPAIRQEIDRLEAQAHQIGVQGVPFFILNHSHGLSGAQPVAVWQDVLRKLSEDATSTS
jgi:predicted DsbA family dithiol-disulfide isomerase